MRGEDEREFNMTQTVLSDPVLTQKVLRLANSGMYSAFGQRINTVSKAVLVLGTEAIGHLALGLKLIEELASPRPTRCRPTSRWKRPCWPGWWPSRSPTRAAEPRSGGSGGLLDAAFAGPHDGHLLPAGALDHAAAGWPAPAPRRGRAAPRAARPDPGTGRPRHRRALGPAAQPDRRHAPGRAGRARRSLRPRRLAGRAGTMSRNAPNRCGTATRPVPPRWRSWPRTLRRCWASSRTTSSAPSSRPRSMRPPTCRSRRWRTRPRSAPAPLAATRMRDAGNKILKSAAWPTCATLPTRHPGQMMSMAIETAYHGLSFTRAFGFLRSRRDGKYSAKIGFGDGAKALLPAGVRRRLRAERVPRRARQRPRDLHRERARPEIRQQAAGLVERLAGRRRAASSSSRCAPTASRSASSTATGTTASRRMFLSQTEFSLLNDLRALVVKSVERRQQTEAVKQAHKWPAGASLRTQ
jgi:hypothetical protein